MTDNSTMTGTYWKTVFSEGKKKGAGTPILYRNYEIDCPECKQFIGTQAISVVRAAFGVKVACKMCRHQFIFRHQESAA